MSDFIKKLETYEDLEVSAIRATKINKVLKRLIRLNTIPRDNEFNFRNRSVELLGKWNKILGAGSPENEPNSGTENCPLSSQGCRIPQIGFGNPAGFH
jgi:hypothetical protein